MSNHRPKRLYIRCSELIDRVLVKNSQVLPWLTCQAQENGQDLALVWGDQALTFTDLEALSLQVAANLMHLGCQVGDRLAILCQNSVELVALIHGLVKVNAVSVHLNWRLSWQELSWQVQNSGAKYLIYDSLSADYARNLGMQKWHLHDLLICQGIASLRGDLARVQNIIYTSGTTGKPKGVILRLQNHYASASSVFERLQILPICDRWLNCLPMYHIGGLSILWRSVIWGIPMLLLPRFDVLEVCRAIAQVTHISLVPTMLYRIIHHPEFLDYLVAWQGLKGILIGGAGINSELLDVCKHYQLPIMPSYGLTEASSQVATLLPADLYKKTGSSGQALSCNQIRIAAPDSPDLELPPLAIGEILLQGDNIINGYIAREVIPGWFRTGDMGYLDSQQFLYVLDRRSDLIISGGENIYPTEIESILIQHPQIQDVCVIGVADVQWGQIAIAVIVGAVLDLEAVKYFCNQTGLASYKIPKRIHNVDHLPTTSTGKPSRELVRQLVLSLKE